MGCQDGAVHIFGASGLRLSPPVVLGGGGIALLECTHIKAPSPTITIDDDEVGDGRREREAEGVAAGPITPETMYLLAITKAGDVRVWDLYRMNSIANTSLRPVFQSIPSLLGQQASSAAAAAPSSSSSSSAGPAAPTSSQPAPRLTRASVRATG